MEQKNITTAFELHGKKIVKNLGLIRRINERIYHL